MTEVKVHEIERFWGKDPGWLDRLPVHVRTEVILDYQEAHKDAPVARVARLGSWYATAGFGANESDRHWERLFTLAVRRRPVSAALSFGWGWDADHPVRPWPRVTWHKGYLCASLCGFFIGLAMRRQA